MNDPIFDDAISSLPNELQDSPEWAEKRNKIIERLQEDAKGLPMSTSQYMLLERMGTFYAITRKREADPEVKMTASDLRSNNQQWLAMTSEFNKQLTVGEDKRRAAMLETILKIVQESVTVIEDPRIRDDLRKHLAEKFKAAGL